MHPAHLLAYPVALPRLFRHRAKKLRVLHQCLGRAAPVDVRTNTRRNERTNERSKLLLDPRVVQIESMKLFSTATKTKQEERNEEADVSTNEGRTEEGNKERKAETKDRLGS